MVELDLCLPAGVHSLCVWDPQVKVAALISHCEHAVYMSLGCGESILGVCVFCMCVLNHWSGCVRQSSVCFLAEMVPGRLFVNPH